MNKEKQKLECEMAEMLEIIEKAREIYANDITDHTENEYIREGLLDAGYRKHTDVFLLKENGEITPLLPRQSEGEWKKLYEKAPRYVCTACNHLFNNKEYKYCPNCGAKMRKEDAGK